ncbi:hypothetical protein [Sulfurovum sp.]|uniref:hypothetical protein n=1 Tax=Sulfurovum sp. TaxID=1969726 RepID=UPI0025FB2367|nr:hypothetical protein [Sulfurovum sp.]
MFYFLIFLAIAIIGLEIFSSKQNKKLYFEKNLTKNWNKIYKWRWIIGIIFIPISIIEYPMFGTQNTVLGFPLIIAAFDEAGRDYVGITTTPFAIINAVIFYFMIQVILYIWSRFIIKTSNKTKRFR